MLARLVQRWDLTLLAMVLLIAVAFVVRMNSHLSGDSAWYLYLGHRLLEGEKLYIDFVEVNPPLGIWSLLPVIWLAKHTGISVILIFTAAALCLVALSLWLTVRLVRLNPSLPPTFLRLSILLVAVAMLFTAEFDFGQREHLMIILVLPWLVLRWLRVEGHGPSTFMAVTVGFLAALGFWQKPHCLLVPVVVEGYLLWKSRSLVLTFAAENITALLASGVYMAAVLLLTPDFLSQIFSLGISAYVPFYGYAWPVITLRSGPLWLVLLLPVIAARQTTGPLKTLLELLTLAAAAFLIVYLIQWKGYFYQLLPAKTVVQLAIGLAIAGLALQLIVPDGNRKLVQYLFVIAFAGLAFSPLFAPVPENVHTVRQLIAANTPNAKSIFIASTNVNASFPLVLEENLVWASRFPAQWLAPYAATKLDETGRPTDEISRFSLSAAVDDLLRFKPEVIVINEAPKQDYYRGPALDFIKFWQNDPRFAAIWCDYELRNRDNGFSVWERKMSPSCNQ